MVYYVWVQQQIKEKTLQRRLASVRASAQASCLQNVYRQSAAAGGDTWIQSHHPQITFPHGRDEAFILSTTTSAAWICFLLAPCFQGGATFRDTCSICPRREPSDQISVCQSANLKLPDKPSSSFSRLHPHPNSHLLFLQLNSQHQQRVSFFCTRRRAELFWLQHPCF